MKAEDLKARSMAKLDDRFRQFLPEIGVAPDKDKEITLGISKRTNLPVSIDSHGSSRITIAAASGTGKSFLANRVINKAIECGFGIVVLDIRGEYRECNLANREHLQYLMPGEMPHGMPKVVQLIPMFCKKDMSPAETRIEKNRAVYFSLAPSQMPRHILRKILGMKEDHPAYFLLERALNELPQKEYRINDLKAKIMEIPSSEEMVVQQRTRRILLNKIQIMEDKKVFSNKLFNFEKTLPEYNLVFNFMYVEDEYLMEMYIGAIVNNIYNIAKRKKIGRQILIKIDEADLLLNKNKWTPAKEALMRLIKLGRLYNISAIFISQTPALLPPLILSQSNYMIIGALMDHEDATEVCKSRGLEPRHSKHHFINLGKFEFTLMDNAHKGRVEHFYAKSCLSKHEEPFKR